MKSVYIIFWFTYAVAHRDYTSNGSVQVMLFRDRLVVFNPGSLPLGWTTENLTSLHTSVPANPLLAEPMYLKSYIERIGTGTTDMVHFAREAGLKDPEFIQDEVFRAVIYRPEEVTGEVANAAVVGAVDGAVDEAVDGATNQTKKRLVILLMAIFKDEGKRIPVYIKATKLGSGRTVDRYIQKLTAACSIEFRGDAAQTGGYYLTEQMKRKLK